MDALFVNAPAERPELPPSIAGEQFGLPGLEQVVAEPPPEAETEREFDWFKDEDVIVESQPSVAVYRNPRDHLVIRQEARDPYENDAFVFLATEEAVRALIAALQRELRRSV